MNNRETFIKMCHCPKIQDQWDPTVGDRVANKDNYEEGTTDSYVPYSSLILKEQTLTGLHHRKYSSGYQARAN